MSLVCHNELCRFYDESLEDQCHNQNDGPMTCQHREEEKMTTTCDKWTKDQGWSQADYVAHLEDAFMRACERIADGPQTYAEVNTPDGWFIVFLRGSKIDKETGESLLILKYCNDKSGGAS